jgi:[ribosomal protein S5]-alanine N-acetyltransferase
MTEFDLETFGPPLRVPNLARGPLLLRPFAASDLVLVRQASADPLIPSITSVPRAYTEESGRAFIERQWQRARDGDGFSFVIADENEPTAGLGSIGLWLHEIESGRASIGYWVLRSERGKGLAGRALRRLAAFAFEELAVPRLHLFVEPWNVASARTAESAGFVRESLLLGWERIDGEQRDAYCYRLLHREWGPDPNGE